MKHTHPVRPGAQNRKKLFRLIASTALTAAILCGPATAFAATGNDPLAVINNFSEFIYSLIRAIGLILVAFGIVQVGLSLKSHDPSQRANGIMTIAGGIVVTFTREILLLITGG